MVGSDVGVPVRDQPVAKLDHLGDVFRRTRLDRRRQHAERGDVPVELGGCLFRQFADAKLRREVRIALGRPRVDLVIDVGDVADVSDVALPVDVTEQAVEHVEHDDRPRITDVREVVNRWPAHIHAHVGRVDWPEFRLVSGQRVVEPQNHRGLLVRAA